MAKQVVSMVGYVGTADIQKFFQVRQPDVVRRWARSGAPHLRIGRMFRWNVTAVEGWLDARTKQTEEQSVD